ncbi:hypothetical protein RyT2_30050 [Pseudolactococcus yaeyamensis]
MFETRNKKIMKKLAVKDFKKNLKRNRLLLASIILCQMILIILINAGTNYHDKRMTLSLPISK